MFTKTVTVRFKGVEFRLAIGCTPNTSIEECEVRALAFLEHLFTSHGIEIVK